MYKVFFSPDEQSGRSQNDIAKRNPDSKGSDHTVADEQDAWQPSQGNIGMTQQAPMEEATPPVTRSGRGFAGMDPARQREIASQGGKASHQQGTGHEWTSEEAARAGRKGGQARGANRRNRQQAQ
jgi:general stress protein YciG